MAPGKFVLCIDARDSDGVLVRGAIYPVVATYGIYLCVEAGPLNGWRASRFVPAPDIGMLLALQTPTKEHHHAATEGQ